jgi:hypothetical protein
MYITRLANDAGAEVATGVIHGVPISRVYGGIMLYQVWIGYVVAAVSCGILAAILNTQIAAFVVEHNLRAVAYLIAAVFGVASLSWVLNAVSSLIHFRSLLRQAEAD